MRTIYMKSTFEHHAINQHSQIFRTVLALSTKNKKRWQGAKPVSVNTTKAIAILSIFLQSCSILPERTLCYPTPANNPAIVGAYLHQSKQK